MAEWLGLSISTEGPFSGQARCRSHEHRTHTSNSAARSFFDATSARGHSTTAAVAPWVERPGADLLGRGTGSVGTGGDQRANSKQPVFSPAVSVRRQRPRAGSTVPEA